MLTSNIAGVETGVNKERFNTWFVFVSSLQPLQRSNSESSLQHVEEKGYAGALPCSVTLTSEMSTKRDLETLYYG